MTTQKRKSNTPNSDPTDLSFDMSNEPGPLLRRCHQRSTDIYNSSVGEEAPTRQQLAIMLALHQIEEATQARISAATGVDRNTIAEILRRLETRGLVEKRPSSRDSRASEVVLSAAGLKTVKRLVPRVREVQEKILSPLPPVLRPVFLQCLRILAGIEPASSLAGSDEASLEE
jgi:DNA-binding MarR family transcriptional regulator